MTAGRLDVFLPVGCYELGVVSLGSSFCCCRFCNYLYAAAQM
jgi:hypothetical protein